MGQRLLAEYAQEHPGALQQVHHRGLGSRYAASWTELVRLDSLKALVPAAVAHMRLLHAVDTFPRGEFARARACTVPLPRAWLRAPARMRGAAAVARDLQRQWSPIPNGPSGRVLGASVPADRAPAEARSPPHARSMRSPCAGGLCQGVYLKEAVRRYEEVWLPLLSAQRLQGQVRARADCGQIHCLCYASGSHF